MGPSKITIGCCSAAALCFVGGLIWFGNSLGRMARDYLQHSTATSRVEDSAALRAEASSHIYGTAGTVDLLLARRLLDEAYGRGDKLAGMRLCLLNITMPTTEYSQARQEQLYKDCAAAVLEGVANGSAEAEHLQAMDNYARGPEYAESALRLAASSAAQGYHPAMLMLGLLNEHGLGKAADPVEAQNWYELAAAQDNVLAQSYLGHLLAQAGSPGEDPARALELLNDSVAKGDSLAMYFLGQLYEEGRIVAADPQAALELYSRASEIGYSRAMTAAGLMYEEGRGLPAERSEALRWYRMAALLQDSDAIARLEALGEPVEKYK